MIQMLDSSINMLGPDIDMLSEIMVSNKAEFDPIALSCPHFLLVLAQCAGRTGSQTHEVSLSILADRDLHRIYKYSLIRIISPFSESDTVYNLKCSPSWENV